MLRIIINGKEAALPLGLELTLKLNSSKFEDRKEDATYPVTLSLAANRHIFGFPERLTNNTLPASLPATVYYGAFQVLQGSVVITDITDKGIELFIATDQRSFWGKIASKPLATAKLGREDFESESQMIRAFNESLAPGNTKDYVVCPLYDPTMTSTDNSRALNYPIFPHWINPYFPDGFHARYDNKYAVFCVFLRLNFVVEQVFKAYGYTVAYNYFNLIPGFRDVVIVNRKQLFSYPYASVVHYEYCVPRLTIKAFLEEVEKKFGVVFLVSENNKQVRIISVNADLKEEGTPIPTEIYDNVEKEVISADEIPVRYLYSDKEVEDAYWKEIQSATENGTSGSGLDDEKKIECISTTLGTADIQFLDRPFYSYPAIAYGDTSKDSGIQNIEEHQYAQEFRLAVYRGKLRLPDNTLLPYISAAPRSTSDDNQLSMMWAGEGTNLYSTFQRTRTEFLLTARQTHKLQLFKAPESLKSIPDLFTHPLLCRGQKYIASEAEIKLSGDRIKEYNAICYPV